jgi:hypothetical protein
LEAPAANLFAGAEAEVLETVFSYDGIRCNVLDGDEVTRSSFLAPYQRDDYDVLWGAAHGRHPLMDRMILRSCWPPPSRCRCRNSRPLPCRPRSSGACSFSTPANSAAANARDVPGGSCLAFGALLVCELAHGSGFAEAFEEAMRAFQDARPRLARRLGDRGLGKQIAEVLHDFRDPTLLEGAVPLSSSRSLQ